MLTRLLVSSLRLCYTLPTTKDGPIIGRNATRNVSKEEILNTDIASQRLFNHHIAGEKFQQPEDVVRWMGALQAQDYLQALWAIGLRMQSATVGAIEQVITDRKILRTWPMRGTLHFVPAEDAKWMLQLSPARLLAGDKRRQQQLEIDETVLHRTQQLFHDALTGGKRFTRSRMMELLEEAGIAPKGQRGYHLLWYMAQVGLICLGPMENKEQTFVLLDEWVPHARELSREEGLAELARRYFTSHGPATLQDFARWAGITLTDARVGLESAKAALRMEKGNGQAYWMAPDAPGQKAGKLSSVHLLPGFDEYLLGYKDRSAVLAAEHAAHIVPGNNGIFFPMIVVGGLIIGTWKRRPGKSALDVVLKPFTSLGGAEEQLSEAVKAYSDFLGLPFSSMTVQGSNED
jgi:hypothetical protein